MEIYHIPPPTVPSVPLWEKEFNTGQTVSGWDEEEEENKTLKPPGLIPPPQQQKTSYRQRYFDSKLNYPPPGSPQEQRD